MRSYWDNVVDIDFRTDDYRFYHLTGWSEPDWTVGTLFTIDFGRLPRRGRLVIRLSASPFLTQRFEVACNGVPAGSGSADRPFVATFPVPPSAMTPDGGLKLSLALSEPKRPSDHAGTTDQRALGLSLTRIEVLGTDVEDRAAWPELPARATQGTDREVLSLFESLGDNCELGFIQKRADVTSSSLLRFCATPVASVLDGLAHRFNRIDAPDGVAIVVDGPEHAREYQVVLRRYNLHYHTLTFTHEIGEEELRERELEKLRYKYSKFLDGLSRRDRIYVLKQNGDLPASTVWTVWLALQRYGANTLLWVRMAGPGERPGEVRVLAPGLLEATIASFAEYTDATQGDDGAWIALFRKALGIVAEKSATAPDTASVAAASEARVTPATSPANPAPPLRNPAPANLTSPTTAAPAAPARRTPVFPSAPGNPAASVPSAAARDSARSATRPR